MGPRAPIPIKFAPIGFAQRDGSRIKQRHQTRQRKSPDRRAFRIVSGHPDASGVCIDVLERPICRCQIGRARMDHNSQADSHKVGLYVEPSAKREHLNKYWIGLGAALDWIALRGQPISPELYRDREDKADEELVATLGDMPSDIAEAIVRGEPDEEPGILVPIPSGIWRRTATSDANDAGQPYRLIGTDDDDPWEGAVLGAHVVGYRKIQIQTAFILEKWPEHTLDIEPTPLGPAAALTAVRRVIERVIATADDEMAPISQREMLTLVKRRLPNARRTQVREIYAKLIPAAKPGPKGRRDPDRQRHIEELGYKLMAAQLHN